MLGDHINYVYRSIIDLDIVQNKNRICKFRGVLKFGSIEQYKASGELFFSNLYIFLLVRSTVSNMEALFNLQLSMTANNVEDLILCCSELSTPSGSGRTWPDLAGLGRTSENVTLCLNFK